MAFEVKVDPPVIRVEENGAVRVGPTRMLFALVISAYKDGKTPEEINKMYTAVSLANLYGAIAYYLNHREESDRFLQEWEEAGDRAQKRNEEENREWMEEMQAKMERRAREQGLVQAN